MKNRLPSLLRALGLAALAATLPACEREAGQPEVLSSEQITGSVPEVFKGADAEARQLAADVVDAIGKQDYPTAWARLQDLNGRPGLTDAQKEFVASSIASVGAEVNKAEETGNEEAQQALQFHRANK